MLAVRSLSVLLLAASAAMSPSSHADTLVGAGSSAAAPVYSVWADEYARARGVVLRYDPVGSGASMAKIKERSVDFGASDVIASPAELDKAGLVMVPTVITGVVPVVNLGGVKPNALHLTGDLLGRIFAGEITQWDASEIRALNPSLALPSRRIRLVARADGSGTTYHFSDYLGRTSATWKARYGVANRFEWPAGTLAVKGSSEVAKTVMATADAIGYIDYNDVLDHDLTGVSLRNADGQWVGASVAGFRQAVLHSAWYSRGDFSGGIDDMPGASTWPITMGTYIAVPRVARPGDGTERALRFLTWGYLNGDTLAQRARFVPLPERVQAAAYKAIATITDADGQSLWSRVMQRVVD